MRSINKVILIGNLTRDPEIRQTPNDQSVTTFGIATNREWVTKSSEKKTSAEFHECVAWARLAEICNNFLKKGHLVYIEGYLKTRSWDSPEGVKKFKTEIVVKDMIKLEKRPKDGENEDNYIPADEEDFESSEESSRNSKKETKENEEVKKEEPKLENTEKSDSSENKEENPVDKDLGL